LHDEGRFEDAIQVLADAEKAALEAICQQQPQQFAAIRANPPNSEVRMSLIRVYGDCLLALYAPFEIQRV